MKTADKDLAIAACEKQIEELEDRANRLHDSQSYNSEQYTRAQVVGARLVFGEILKLPTEKEVSTALYLFDVSYYSPTGGADISMLATDKKQVRAFINKNCERKLRLVDGKDTLEIKQITEITMPFILT